MAWRSRALDHVLRDARLSDLKFELQQLAMNARRSPQWVLDAHLPDQRPQVVCTENLNPHVTMMKPAKDGVRSDASGPLNRARDRSIFVQ